MNFCPKCGAPFKSTALPTPIYSSVYTPTNQPIPWRTAPIPSLVLFACWWTFLALMFCLQNDAFHHFSTVQVIPLLVAGGMIAFYPIYKYTLNQLRVLKEKGEIVYSKKRTMTYLIISVAAVIIFGALLLYYMPPNPPSYWFLLFNLVYPMPTIVFATRAMMYHRWQKENHKWILWEKQKLIAVQPYHPNYIDKF